METPHLILLAIVQGIAEFLPISSSAHLVLVPRLLGWEDQGLIFDLSLHLGTLIAVMVYFRADILNMLAGLIALLRGKYRDDNARLLLNLTVATIPVGLAGLAMMDLIQTAGRDLHIIAFTTIVFGLLLWFADYQARTRKEGDTLTALNHITLGTALTWGVYQAVALIPGVSRSGICVIGGRALGATRKVAGEFGSLMSIPVTLLAVLASLGDVDASLNWHNAFTTLALGAFFSFLFALAGIHILITWCSRMGYMPFVLYRMALGALLIGFIFF